MTASRRQTLAWSLTLVLHSVSPTDGASAEPWSRAFVGGLPDEAFAVAHVRPDRTKSRHQPHHDAAGRHDWIVGRPHHVLVGVPLNLGEVVFQAPARHRHDVAV